MRIVAGRWRGKRLDVGRGCGQRPTQERVREAIFSRLGECVPGAVVLDLFAGTGALGLEALSRGAVQATFVEKSPAAIMALKRNIRALKAGSLCRVVEGDAFRFLTGQLGRVDSVTLLFADPPYGELAASLAGCLERATGLTWGSGAVRVIECSKRDPVWPSQVQWRPWSVKEYGETRVFIEEREI
ncbi:MAG: 16S rRNA (guanine(966)-N(2))-methyltransferase RsmD [Candidatus Eisenbacteria sp.]|nr:16S rRNA (guanine(966)-N(2))-methyltransferase RsmD [Candidatus Eisenbacteria bacterium]